MLSGARPERIQCLTFTKAAAAEMAVRLQRRLGEWVALDAPVLEARLRDLAIAPEPEVMRRARSLFAHVLDLPGGMRIGTIHAFCQSLLRRFPLEASLSPHFQLVEQRDADATMTEAREALLSTAREAGLDPSLRTLSGQIGLAQFTGLVTDLKQSRGKWKQARLLGPGLAAARRRVLQVAAPDRDALLATSVVWRNEPALRDAARDIQRLGSAGIQDKAARILDWLSLAADRRAAAWPDWIAMFHVSPGKIRGPGALVNPKLAKTRPDLLDAMLGEGERLLRVESTLNALDTAALSEALTGLAAPLLDGYEARKEAASQLEFDDLIGKSSELLIDPGAAWVLYKLDGGLDHLLLDEVQDTAPEQWDIAHKLTEEFFAGSGASDTPRTIFAVGDRKQSIFSFQGADAAGFERARARLRGVVEASGQPWVDTRLEVSFRSTTPVLALVDAVFDDPIAARGVVAEGEVLRHRADRAAHAGMVELWPVAEAPAPEPPAPWSVPDRNERAESASGLLAEQLAVWIRDRTGGDVMLESRNRPLRPGDVMILVRRRDAFCHMLVRALKSLGVPIAGLDRMMLTEQPAVQDLIALGDALLLPQDDLAFACVLTSPLGGLNDDDLMALAMDRGSAPLWTVLRDRHRETPAWTRAWTFFAALLSRVDYVPPHALLAEALGPLGGRARLFARLGVEAAEPVDELLNAALKYADTHPPSLQGFLQWLRRSGAEVKREAEAAGDRVRILTVHGAKGLQAPLVILPDTTALPPDLDLLFWGDDAETQTPVPIWVPRAALHSEATIRIRDGMRQRAAEEHNRLLYVALTRAEDRLVVCGWKARGELPDSCWYASVARGFARLTDAPEGDFARFASAQTTRADEPRLAAAAPASLPPPAFLGSPPPAEPARPMPLAPSRPEGVALGPVPASASPLARIEAGADRFQRGQLIHGLLQHLPALAAADRAAAAVRFLERPGHGLPAGAAPAIAAEAMAILTHPDLAPLFGPDSRAEVPLTGVVGDVVVGGLVDRLVVLAERVLLADFKTNRRPPSRVEDTPVAYLRQMASYRAVLRGIFPGRSVHCALIWTREARVAALPDALLDPHEPGRGGSV